MDHLRHFITFEMHTEATTVPTSSVRSWIRYSQFLSNQEKGTMDILLQAIVNRYPRHVPKQILMQNEHVIMLMAPAPRDISLPTAVLQSELQSDKYH